MKIKKWQVLLAATLVILAAVLSPVAALAAADNATVTTENIRPLKNGGLEIVAPHVARVNQPVNLQVFSRQTLEPVPDTGIWAINRDNAETVKDDLKALKQQNPDPTESDLASVLNHYGFLMGRTDENGKLSYAFDTAATYVMIAVKAHYWPDFNVIVIGNGALGIKSPRHAAPGEAVTLTVFERGEQTPVTGAGVWAIGKDNITAVKEQIAALRESRQLKDTDVDGLLTPYGMFLGKTDENGELTCTFKHTGRYLLVAVKPGYIPGINGIAIGEPQVPTAVDTTTTVTDSE